MHIIIIATIIIVVITNIIIIIIIIDIHWFSESTTHTFKFDLLNLWTKNNYRQVSNIRRTLVGNKIFDHSGVVGASPVGVAPTTSSFST